MSADQIDQDRIDHYREAETTLDVVEFANGAQTSPSYTEYALAEATLALAYEQRTANLIALWSMPEPEAAGLASAAGKDRDGVEKDIWNGLASQIIERLGLA
jgi:hypothetical protein